MSSPCLSGGGRAYGFDLELVKSPSTSTRTSHSSSPSSTLSESSNSPLAISTRKPRTPRKRPNQTYNEAAALLSTAYPNIFSAKNLIKPQKFTKPHEPILLDEPSDLLLPFRVFDNSCFLLHHVQPIQETLSFVNEPKASNFSSCDNYNNKSPSQSSGEVVDFHGNSMELCGDGFDDDFDAESIIVDEEIEEGIDSIMGNLSVSNEMFDGLSNDIGGGSQMSHFWYGNPMGFNFGGKHQLSLGIGMRKGVRALRQVDEGHWWHFPIVDMHQISPRLGNNNNNNKKKGSNWNVNQNSTPKSKSKSKSNCNANSNSSEKKKKKVEEKPAVELENVESAKEKEDCVPQSSPGLLLKLNYDEVLNAWSDRGLPFSEEALCSEGNDVSARLAQIDLFSESGGVREASVLRYKEKRRTRLFSNKIRYEVRKVNADRRPRMKGRFVRRSNSSSTNSNNQEEKSKKCFKL